MKPSSSCNVGLDQTSTATTSAPSSPTSPSLSSPAMLSVDLGELSWDLHSCLSRACGQSLWPTPPVQVVAHFLMLFSGHYPCCVARHSPDGVDVRSCVLSLVDLFSHWLGQPIHPLLLLHTLRAILMLSDLFSLVCTCGSTMVALFTSSVAFPVSVDAGIGV